jgi:ABC-type multidrug transport system ATPase subunit
LLTILSEPNVLVLDEPTNDVDTDMLAATEDLLDSWPGTLIVVSHDRYLLERVTDQQYAILDGHLRHLPRGVDEYLELAKAQSTAVIPDSPTRSGSAPSTEALSGAELRNVQKEITSIERSLVKFDGRIAAMHAELAAHDQSDHIEIGRLTMELRSLEDAVAAAEARWLELSELVD